MSDMIAGFPVDLNGWDWDSGEPQEQYDELLVAYLDLLKDFTGIVYVPLPCSSSIARERKGHTSDALSEKLQQWLENNLE